MRREVFGHPDVADAAGEAALAARRDLVDLADVALAESPAQLLQRGIESLDVTDHSDQAAPAECVGNEVTGFGVIGDRLLDEACTPASASANAASAWNRVGDGDDGDVDPLRDERLDVGLHIQAAGNAVGIATGSATATSSTPSRS